MTNFFQTISAGLIVLFVVALPFLKGGMLTWVAPALIGLGLLLFISHVSSKLLNGSFIFANEIIWFLPLFVLTTWILLQLFVFPSVFGWYSVFSAEDIQGTFFEDFNSPIDLITSLQWLGYFFTYWCVVWVSSSLKEKPISIILWSMVVVSGVIAAYALFAYFGKHQTILGIWPKTDYLCCATGSFVNRNHFANYLALCLPVALYCFFLKGSLSKNTKFLFVAAVAYLIVVISAVLSAQSRMGVTVVFVGVVIWYLYFYQHARAVGVSKYIKLLAVLLGVVILFWVLWFGFDDLINRFSQANLGDSRKEFRETMYSMPAKAWLLGIQPGVFSDIYSFYAPSDINFRLNHAHNDYLEFALEIGLIGVMLFLISVIPVLKRKKKMDKSVFRVLAVPIIFVMVIHSLVDFSLHIPANAIYFCIALGLLMNKENANKVSSIGVENRVTSQKISDKNKKNSVIKSEENKNIEFKLSAKPKSNPKL